MAVIVTCAMLIQVGIRIGCGQPVPVSAARLDRKTPTGGISPKDGFTRQFKEVQVRDE